MRKYSTTFSRSQEALTDALALSRMGWAVVPLKPSSKLPLVPWKAYQTRKLAESEIISVFEQNPDLNVGVVTGKVSGLLVLDADTPSVVKNLGVPLTVIAETARGRHYYFKLTDEKIRSVTGLADGLDVKAQGGYVVSPPSLHPTGKPYTWVIPPRGLDPWGADPAPPPDWLMQLIHKHRARQQEVPALDRIVHGVEEGVRNDSSTVLIGKLLGCLPVKDWERIAWPLLRGWNALNRPPLPERELRQVFEKIARRELKQRTQASTEARLKDALKNICQQLKISQRQLSRLTKIPVQTLNRWLTKTTEPHTPPIWGNETLLKEKCRFEADFDSESVSQPCERGVNMQIASGIRCKARTVRDFERR